MINLLPDEFKKQIVSARSNVKLVNYTIILAAGIVFLGFITAAVYFVLVATKANAEAAIASNQSKTSEYSNLQAQVAASRAGLSSAQQTLDQQVLYSKVLTGIAAVLPPGTIIQTLSLTPATFDAPITLTVYAKTTDDALKVKDNFQQSASFSGISMSGLTPGGSGEYPVTITLGMTISKALAQ